jgi:hypothetical protein
MSDSFIGSDHRIRSAERVEVATSATCDERQSVRIRVGTNAGQMPHQDETTTMYPQSREWSCVRTGGAGIIGMIGIIGMNKGAALGRAVFGHLILDI